MHLKILDVLHEVFSAKPAARSEQMYSNDLLVCQRISFWT